MTSTPYDQLRYPGKFYPQASPSRLAAVARLHGLDPPALGTSRILEIGCGEGGQLVPIAQAFPHSRCLGIDSSEASIERAQDFSQRAEIGNCRFLAQDLLDFPADAGEFDYIIAHGLYSWVPETVQQVLLAICARHLSANGLAYVSYNAYPGGHVRQILRDLTVFQTRGINDPLAKTREARKVAEFIVAAMPGGTLERQLFERLLAAYRDSDALFRFDLLSEENSPVYFLDFMEAAQASGLKFVADSSAPARDPSSLPEAVRGWLESIPERLVREQYLDFVVCRAFRQTILHHGDTPALAAPSASTLTGMYLRSALQPIETPVPLDDGSAVKFRNPLGAELSCAEAIPKTVYLELGEAYPRALRYDALRERIVRRLGLEHRLDPAEESKLVGMLRLSDARGVVELYAEPPRFASGVGRKPQASLLARLQAEAGMPITVRSASGVMLADAHVRSLIGLLDGGHDLEQLLAEWQQQVGEQHRVQPAILERTLRMLGNEGLLVE